MPDLSGRLRVLLEEYTAQGLAKLPPERDLAAQLGVARGTLRRELAVLERDGLVFRTLGRSGGTYLRRVVEAAPIHAEMFDLRTTLIVRDLNHVSGVPQMLARQGRTVRTEVLASGIEQPDHKVAELLGLAQGAEVISLLRLRWADEQTWSLERMYLPSHRFPGLLADGPVVSVYATLDRDYGVKPDRFQEHIEVIPADSRVAGLLRIRTGSPLYALRRVSWDPSGLAIETSVDFFRTDRTQLRFTAHFEGPGTASS